MNNKLDISSTVLEKGIDIAKDFLDKLIMPSIEEVGLLLKDKVTLWKFNNQVKMLNKAKDYCEKNNISTKAISMKLLCPLLESAALEEDEELQDKWAILLANMVDSEQNVENHVFPYLLSQISINEFSLLELTFNQKVKRIEQLSAELAEFRAKKPIDEQKIKEKIKNIESIIEEKKNNINQGSFAVRNEIWELQMKKMEFNKELRSAEAKEREILNSLALPENVPQVGVMDYEISNLIRLGVIKSIYRPYAYVHRHRIKNDPDSEYLNLEDLEIEIEADADDYIMTELGELFISACSEKRVKTVSLTKVSNATKK